MRIRGWVGDADVDDPFHTGFDRGIHQYPGILHSFGLCVAALVEAHPIRIDQHFHAAQALDQFRFVHEIQGMCLHLSAEWVRAVGMIGQRDDIFASFQQTLCDVLARITEGTCDCDFHFASTFGVLGANSAKKDTNIPMQTSANSIAPRLPLIFPATSKNNSSLLTAMGE